MMIILQEEKVKRLIFAACLHYKTLLTIINLKNTGLLDTAVKTAETGYMQRRLVKGILRLL